MWLLQRQIIITNRNVTIKLAIPSRVVCRVVCKTSRQWRVAEAAAKVQHTTCRDAMDGEIFPTDGDVPAVQATTFSSIALVHRYLLPLVCCYNLELNFYQCTDEKMPFATDHSKRCRPWKHKTSDEGFTLFQQYFAICYTLRHMISILACNPQLLHRSYRPTTTIRCKNIRRRNLKCSRRRLLIPYAYLDPFE